jgi:hypothetical protein
MADISKELDAWKNAIYGEEVRDAQVNLSKKINSEVEAGTKRIDNYGKAESARNEAETNRVNAEKNRDSEFSNIKNGIKPFALNDLATTMDVTTPGKALDATVAKKLKDMIPDSGSGTLELEGLYLSFDSAYVTDQNYECYSFGPLCFGMIEVSLDGSKFDNGAQTIGYINDSRKLSYRDNIFPAFAMTSHSSDYSNLVPSNVALILRKEGNYTSIQLYNPKKNTQCICCFYYLLDI